MIHLPTCNVMHILFVQMAWSILYSQQEVIQWLWAMSWRKNYLRPRDLDLDEGTVYNQGTLILTKGNQGTSQPWNQVATCKSQNLELVFNWCVFCCSLVLWNVWFFICLIWIYFYQENFYFFSSLKKIWSLKLEAWNLKLEIWNLGLEILRFAIWNFRFWRIETLEHGI